MNIAALIGIMIGIVVGINILIPATKQAADTVASVPIVSPVGDVAQAAASSSAASSMLTILPIIFVAVIILGAVAWIGLLGEGEFKTPSMPGFLKRKKREPAYAYATGYAEARVVKNPRDLVQRIESASQKWGEYLNNLDELLGIRTVVNDNPDRDIMGLRLDRVSGENLLRIDEKSYNWFIADKAPDQDVFKIVGLHKKDAKQNRVYLLGKNSEGQPFLLQLPNLYIDAAYKCDDLITWAKGTGGYSQTMGVEEEGELVGVRAIKAEAAHSESSEYMGAWST